jgi:hypothetical protein
MKDQNNLRSLDALINDLIDQVPMNQPAQQTKIPIDAILNSTGVEFIFMSGHGDVWNKIKERL